MGLEHTVSRGSSGLESGDLRIARVGLRGEGGKEHNVIPGGIYDERVKPNQ